MANDMWDFAGLPPVFISNRTTAMIAEVSEAPQNLPGTGFLGWLGRQVGHVAKAVKTDVTVPPESPTPLSAAEASKIVYRECTIEEQASPTDPNVKLRRTIIDEVVKEVQSAECKVQNEDKA
jgi:hypothetical protein